MEPDSREHEARRDLENSWRGPASLMASLRSTLVDAASCGHGEKVLSSLLARVEGQGLNLGGLLIGACYWDPSRRPRVAQ